jgi:hypothetical protein
MLIGERLRALREEKKLSQGDIGALGGSSPSQNSAYIGISGARAYSYRKRRTDAKLNGATRVKMRTCSVSFNAFYLARPRATRSCCCTWLGRWRARIGSKNKPDELIGA